MGELLVGPLAATKPELRSTGTWAWPVCVRFAPNELRDLLLSAGEVVPCLALQQLLPIGDAGSKPSDRRLRKWCADDGVSIGVLKEPELQTVEHSHRSRIDGKNLSYGARKLRTHIGTR